MTFFRLFKWVPSGALHVTLLMTAIATANYACGRASWQRLSADTKDVRELPQVTFVEPSSRIRRLRFQKAPDDCVLQGDPRPDMASAVWLALSDKIATGKGEVDVYVFRAKDTSQSIQIGNAPLPREARSMVLLDIRERTGKLILDVPLDTTVYCLEFRYERGALVHITVDDVYGFSASASSRQDDVAERARSSGLRSRHVSTEPTTSSTSELPR
jgi:hypothetical protein